MRFGERPVSAGRYITRHHPISIPIDSIQPSRTQYTGERPGVSRPVHRIAGPARETHTGKLTHPARQCELQKRMFEFASAHGYFIDCVKRIAMEQLFVVSGAEADQVQFVDESFL